MVSRFLIILISHNNLINLNKVFKKSMNLSMNKLVIIAFTKQNLLNKSIVTIKALT